MLVGITWAYRSRASGVLVELSKCKPQVPGTPVAQAKGVEGTAAVVCWGGGWDHQVSTGPLHSWGQDCTKRHVVAGCIRGVGRS